MTLTIGSLCTGYGGLELAAADLFDTKLEWVSEIDSDANRVLEERFGVPNIGDLRSADPTPVDIVTAGFPCQPLSHAGHQKGIHDERWIWDDIQNLVGRMDPRPRLLLFENVPGLLAVNDGNAMARVVQGLGSIGYVGQWRTHRASDSGACHRRERVFIVAYPDGQRPEGPLRARSRGPVAGQPADRRGGRRDATTSDSSSAGMGTLRRTGGRDEDAAQGGSPSLFAGTETAHAADLETGGGGAAGRLFPTPQASDKDRGPDLARFDREGSGGPDLTTTVERLLPTPVASDAHGSRRATARTDDWSSNEGTTLLDAMRLHPTFGPYAMAVAHHMAVTDRIPPPPVDGSSRLNPAFVEWMMMLPEGWVTGIDLSRTAQLRVLGNGVVWKQAADAYRLMLR